MSETIVFQCPICGASGKNNPPHGWLQACPYKLQELEAYVQMLDAQRMSYIRSSGSMEMMLNSLKKMTGQDDDE